MRTDYSITGKTLSKYPDIIKAAAQIKAAQAKTHADFGFVSRKDADFITKACNDVVRQPPQELLAQADRARLLFRAILMRNYGRCRDMEVETVFPFMTYPDPAGDTVTWDEWNDWVDLYYKTIGFDLATGWPFRSTWEKAGLGDVADELDALGLVPPEGGTPGYVRRANPFDGHVRKKEEQA